MNNAESSGNNNSNRMGVGGSGESRGGDDGEGGIWRVLGIGCTDEWTELRGSFFTIEGHNGTLQR